MSTFEPVAQGLIDGIVDGTNKSATVTDAIQISIAISLKRIADALVEPPLTMRTDIEVARDEGNTP